MESTEQTADKLRQVKREIGKVIVGKEEITDKILMAILAKGHILIEDIPGVGKTTLAMAVSKAMELEHHRMQFTPDVLPTDVTGYHIYQKETGKDLYRPGAVLCNLFLADEINRTSSKTQSALLEVMEEGRVTVDGITREVPKPFVVIATQNPIGSVGTQMLPESQMDRFMVRLSMGYPDYQSEIDILKGRSESNPLDAVERVITRAELLLMQAQTEQVYVHDSLYAYVVSLVHATREHSMIELGLSPRGALALMNMAKASAYLAGRSYLLPEDVKGVFEEVAAHRILLKAKARMNQVTAEQCLREIIKNVTAPKLVKKRA